MGNVVHHHLFRAQHSSGEVLGTSKKSKSLEETRALAFTLPHSQGGHRVERPFKIYVEVKYVDMNILAADMGVSVIPQHHEEAGKFFPPMLPGGARIFDLAICGGAVVRTQERACHREQSEALRLSMAQLVHKVDDAAL